MWSLKYPLTPDGPGSQDECPARATPPAANWQKPPAEARPDLTVGDRDRRVYGVGAVAVPPVGPGGGCRAGDVSASVDAPDHVVIQWCRARRSPARESAPNKVVGVEKECPHGVEAQHRLVGDLGF
jgi:hypothetical protein